MQGSGDMVAKGPLQYIIYCIGSTLSGEAYHNDFGALECMHVRLNCSGFMVWASMK